MKTQVGVKDHDEGAGASPSTTWYLLSTRRASRAFASADALAEVGRMIGGRVARGGAVPPASAANPGAPDDDGAAADMHCSSA